jgi:hypothetical protein
MDVSNLILPDLLPNSKRYKVEARAKFPSYSGPDGRERYWNDYGVQAPPFDPKQDPKDWRDPNADPSSQSPAFYKILGRDSAGNPALVGYSITQAAAAKVNLLGAYQYPVYEVKPTEAYYVVNGVRTINVPANLLCTRAEAEALQREIAPGANPIPAVVEYVLGGSVPDSKVQWGSETRRAWQVTYRGTLFNAAPFIATRNRNGVGSPGHYNLSESESQPVWVPEVQPNGTNVGPIPTAQAPTPIWELHAEERLVSASFGVTEIERTDLPEPGIPHAGDPVGGSSTVAGPDSQDMKKVLSWLSQIANALGVQLG